MEDKVEFLNERRRRRDAENRNYIEAFLDSRLCTAIEQCFLDAERGSYSHETLRNYRRYMQELDEKGILKLNDPVVTIRRREAAIVFTISNSSLWSPSQKKLRIHALIFVFRHLAQETNGLIKPITMPLEFAKIRPERENSRKAASYDEVQEIFHLSAGICLRDSLVLEMIYQTQQSLQKVLQIKYDDLNFEDNIIWETAWIDTLPMKRLKEYIDSTKEIRGDSAYIFLSNQGRLIHRTQVQKTLERANEQARLPYAITTKMIQRSKQSKILNQEA